MGIDLVAVAGLVAALGAGYLGLRAGRAHLRFRGTRIVPCPECHEPATLELDLARVAFSGAVTRPRLRVKRCSRWPDQAGCGQGCLAQVEAAPEDTLVQAQLLRWYRGKRCVLCGWHFPDRSEHPALLGPDKTLRQWYEFPPERLPEALATHRPVCWNCEVVETLKLEHPELIVGRPARTHSR
jgi:hypothetical protein